MESVISRLLSDFESGKLTRRQLVQTLALVAVGSPVMSACAQSAATGGTVTPRSAAPWKTVWLDHISYSVADYKKSADFYADLMGWQVRNDNGTNQSMLDINGIGNIIIRNARRPSTTAAAAPASGQSRPDSGSVAQSTRPPITGVINHIAYGVEPWDTEAVRAELTRRGLSPREDFQGESYRSFHVRDPDGWDLQISNQTKNRPIPSQTREG